MAPGHNTAQTAPKQFLELAGIPILIRTLRAFAEIPEVTTVIVAVRSTEIERLTAHIFEHGFLDRVRVVEGGDSRQESVRHALAALDCAEDDIVLVHDAVRPLIEPAVIRRVIEAVEKHSAAGAGHNQAGGADGGRRDYHGDDSAGIYCAGADAAGISIWAAAAGVRGGGGGRICWDG